MTPDLDIYRAANELIHRYGDDAPIHAAVRADAMLNRGDMEGYRVWKRVIRAIETIMGSAEPSERLH